MTDEGPLDQQLSISLPEIFQIDIADTESGYEKPIALSSYYGGYFSFNLWVGYVPPNRSAVLNNAMCIHHSFCERFKSFVLSKNKLSRCLKACRSL